MTRTTAVSSASWVSVRTLGVLRRSFVFFIFNFLLLPSPTHREYSANVQGRPCQAQYNAKPAALQAAGRKRTSFLQFFLQFARPQQVAYFEQVAAAAGVQAADLRIRLGHIGHHDRHGPG